jgi:tetratricopeptide (TPR) repeat protein
VDFGRVVWPGEEGGGWGNTYNQAVVFSRNLVIRLCRAKASTKALMRVLAGVCAAAVLAAGAIRAEAQGDGTQSGVASADKGRILLVLPFDNRTGQPNLEWMREAAAEILSARFRSAGFAPMSRPDRLYALDHLGLPQGFHPSRASSLKLAETLDADSIIVGSYVTDGTGIVAEARVVDVPHLRMSEEVQARGEMREMMQVFDSLAWKLTRQMDSNFSAPEESFLAAGRGLPLTAFEQYIRGITEPDQAERLRHLNQAVTLSPQYSEAWMALGREEYNGQQYEQAAKAFARVGIGSPDALEAGFFRGLALVFEGDYPGAEQAFAGVAQVLPLGAVVNDEGVAASRQGHDGTALFRQAVAADSNNADYRFNLAVSLKRHGATAEALAELGQCERLRPSDSEAQALDQAWGHPALGSGTAASASADVKAEPLERIARSFDAAAFRQAVAVMDQMAAARLAAMKPSDQALEMVAQGNGYLDRGLTSEAGRMFASALLVAPNDAEAHAGLAEVKERSGDAEGAQREARAALVQRPVVEAYLVLGRQELAAGELNRASNEVSAALTMDPKNRKALELQERVEARLAGKQ